MWRLTAGSWVLKVLPALALGLSSCYGLDALLEQIPSQIFLPAAKAPSPITLSSLAVQLLLGFSSGIWRLRLTAERQGCCCSMAGYVPLLTKAQLQNHLSVCVGPHKWYSD
jgi:hypothetical protein